LCGPLDQGAAGAAWATVISQGVSFLLSVVFLRRSEFVFDFRRKSFRIDKTLLRELLRIGLPSSAGASAASFSFIVLTGVGNSIAGIVGNTALSVTGKINSVAILPALAMQASVSSMAAQNLGAGKQKRALHTTYAAIGITLSFTLLLFFLVRRFAPLLVRFFIGGESEGLSASTALACMEQSVVYLHSISWDYILVSFVFNIIGLAMAAGHTRFSLFTGLISSLVVRVPASWILGKTLGLGLAGMGFAAPIAATVSLALNLAYLASGRWKKSRVLHTAPPSS
jgi:Na+-driven multidrug efflux pump